MNLLHSEQKAVDFIGKYGQNRATRVLDALCRRFDRRYEKACESSFSPINRESVYKTPLEVDLTHLIKMGLTLTDTYNTPLAAKKRLLERREKRKAQRAKRIIA